jgi:MYXO-CTERM domain-containing protein
MKIASSVAAIAALGVAGIANGQVWNEVGDAGDLTSNAQAVAGLGTLSSIVGNWANGQDIDMYCIEIKDAQAFVAEVIASTGFTDTQMYLFNAAGQGIAFDDDSGLSLFSRIGNDNTINTGSAPSINGQPNLIANAGNGIYYLAISRFDADALNLAGGTQVANGIWHDGSPFDGPFAPDGPGAGSSTTLAGWIYATASATTGSYTISLTGASFVPAPGALALLGLAGLVGHSRRRRV